MDRRWEDGACVADASFRNRHFVHPPGSLKSHQIDGCEHQREVKCFSVMVEVHTTEFWLFWHGIAATNFQFDPG
ncbi:hypothetical protein GOP47_0002577 [Adiantum capillus-veneris]|uniref:Uncharacterized protein n=1 Tax=Adiantum capillus-veneris TaxID=13818 RepID=A0A9D4VB57_ADICA|nr:hypothetical protein GOP47_0002577 [Adiantum capillus-veneris]